MEETQKLTDEQNRLIRNNIALAKHLYGVYVNRLGKNIDFALDANELFSQAYLGLIRAAIRWRPYGEMHGYSEESIASGEKFGVFARKAIIGQMLDSLRKIDHVHPLVRKDYKLLILNGLGSAGVTEQELAQRSKLTLARVQRVIKAVHARPVSLDEPSAEASEDSFSMYDGVANEHNVESSAMEIRVREAFAAAQGTLTGVQQVIVALKYYSGMELLQISGEIGIGIAMVRKEHADALIVIYDVIEQQVREAS